MTTELNRQRQQRWLYITLCTFSALLAGCAGLPEPDGVEAYIIERANNATPLIPSREQNVQSIAHNGLLKSPSVREAASEVSASADQIRVERAALFPQLSLFLGAGTGDAGSGDPALELSGSQLLFNGGQSRRAIKVADFDLHINYLAFQQAVDDSLRDLLITYQNVYQQSELLNIYKRQLNALSELKSLIASRVNSGAASSADQLEAQKRLQAAEFLVNDTQLALGEAQDRLILLSGQSEGGPVDLSVSTCKAHHTTNEQLMAQLEVGRAQLLLEQADNARVPKVVLNPIVRGELGSDGLPLGLNLAVQSDFLQGGALRAKAKVAHNNLATVKAALDNVDLEERLSERGLQRSIASGERKTQMLHRQIDLLSKTRDVYRSQYFDMGTRQISELLDNEEEYYMRQAELVQLRADLMSDRLECAVRSRVLREQLDLERRRVYGYPLSTAQ